MIQWLIQIKINPSTDNDLKLDHLKLELLVIVSYNITVNHLFKLYKPPVNDPELIFL